MRDLDVGSLILQVISGTVRNILVGFIIERQSRGLSKATIRFYLGELNLFCAFLDSVGVVNLHEITPDVIRKYILQLGTTRNAGGCHAAYRAIRAFMLWYEEEFEPDGWRNPIRKVHPPKVTKQALPGVPVGDIQKMVAACTTSMGKRDKAILLCLTDTGARAGECVALNIKDVDFITGAVKIIHGKGDKTRRVKVHDALYKSLATWADVMGLILGEGEGPIFYNLTRGGNSTGKVLNTSVIGRLVGEYGYLAGLAPRHGENCLSPHDMRRTCARNAYDNGATILQVQHMLGHSDPKTTIRYIGADENDDDTAVDYVRY